MIVERGEPVDGGGRGGRSPRRPPGPGAAALCLLLATAAAAARPETADDPAGPDAHVVALLDRHDHALAQRLELIDGADSSLAVSTFIVEPDPVALDLLWHLRRAARRGVRVRLLLDAQFNRLPEPMLGHLTAEGIEVRLYHPLRWYKPGWINTRLHDKLLLADTVCPAAHDPASEPAPGSLILGGRNLSQPYFGIPGRLPRAYVDRDVRVDGPVTVDACRYFDAVWASRQTRVPRLGFRAPDHDLDDCSDWSAVRRVRCRRQTARRDRELPEQDALLDAAHADAGHPLPSRGPTALVVDDVRFLADPVGDKDLDLPILHRLFPQPDRIGPQLLEVFRLAQREVVIESPYLVPSRGLRRALDEARDRGVSVRILTNSIRTTDNLLPQAAYRNNVDDLLDLGVELWEYAGDESLHAKSAVLDGRWSVIGSYNLDPRSEHLNTEIALVFDDTELATALRASMDGRLADSWHRTTEGIANRDTDRRYPGVARGKILRMTLLRLVAPLLHRQI